MSDDATSPPSDPGAEHDPRIRPVEIAPGRVSPGHATKPQARLLGLIPVAAAFGVIVLAIQFLDEVYEGVKSGGAADIVDRPVQSWMVHRREGWLDTAATAYTFLGGKVGMSILATVVVVALALWWRTRTPLVLMVVAAAGSLTLTMQGKVLIGRARPPFEEAVPPLETSASFPSGHTLNAVVVATVLTYLVLLYVVSRIARVLTVVALVCFCVLMGLSRIYLGHHWLTDVLAGAAAGLAWALAVALGHWVYVRLRTKDRVPTVRAVAQEHRREIAARTVPPAPAPPPGSATREQR